MLIAAGFEVWQKYFDDDLLDMLVAYTNQKARIKTSPKPSYYQYEFWPPKFIETWRDVEKKDLLKWFAVLIAKNSLGRGIPI